jgi:colicin import membrane protein
VFLTKPTSAGLDSRDAAKAAIKAQAKAQAAAIKAQVAATKAQAAAAAAVLKAQAASSGATAAAQRAAVQTAARSAAANVNTQVRQGIFAARRWTAPKLEDAADYTTSTVAPTVAAALRSGARQVRPQDAAVSSRKMLTWSLLGAAIVAAVGAAAALACYRYQAAEDDAVTGEQADGEPQGGPSQPGQQEGPAPGDSAESSVNGRVSSTGW